MWLYPSIVSSYQPGPNILSSRKIKTNHFLFFLSPAEHCCHHRCFELPTLSPRPHPPPSQPLLCFTIPDLRQCLHVLSKHWCTKFCYQLSSPLTPSCALCVFHNRGRKEKDTNDATCPYQYWACSAARYNQNSPVCSLCRISRIKGRRIVIDLLQMRSDGILLPNFYL